LWYCDIAPAGQASYPLNPPVTIRGVYGEEDADEWPWLEENYAYSWRDAGLIDVSRSGTSGDPNLVDSLKYASQWRFNSDGTRAVCMRDCSYPQPDAYHDWRTYFIPIQNGSNTALGAHGYVHMAGMNTAMLEMALDHTVDGVTVTKTWSGVIQERTEDYGVGIAGWYNGFWVRTSNLDPFPPDEQDEDPEDVAHLRMIPAAADYVGDDDVPTVAFRVLVSPGGVPYWAYGNFVMDTYYGGAELAAWGRYNDDWSAVRGTAVPLANNRSDVAAGGFTYDTMPDFPMFLDITDQVVTYAGLSTWAADTCWSEVPTRISMWRSGLRLFQREFTHAAPFYGSYVVTCTGTTLDNVNPFGAIAQASIARMAQPSYARERDGEWCAAMQFRPQALNLAAPRVGQVQVVDAIGSDLCGSTYGPCQQPMTFSTTHAYDDDDDSLYGGALASSINSIAALASMMQTPGENPSSLYARVV
jgi:hypothetical protein